MFSFAPLNKTLKWPQKMLPKDSNALEEIGFTDFGIVQDGVEFESSGEIAWLKEIEFPFPALDSVSLVLLGGNGMTKVGFTYRRRPDFEVRLVNLQAALRLQTNLLRRVHWEEDKWVPSLKPNGEPMPVDIVLFGAEVAVLADWEVSVVPPMQISLPAVELGNTGIVLEISEIQLYLSERQDPPVGAQAGFKGVTIKKADLHLSGGWEGNFVPKDVVLTDLLIGSSGFSGHIKANWQFSYNKDSKTFSGDGSGKLFGIPFGLESVELELRQNQFQKSEIKGELLLPFFDKPVKVDIGVAADGGFSASLTSAGQGGLYKLTKDNILEMELDSVGFEINDGLFTAKLSGQITPLFGKDQGLNWPSFQVDELSIDSKGHVHLDGGWLNLREQYSLDFHGFHIGITKIGFGKTDDGGKWVGVSGELKLVDGFTAGASVEGLRITWYDNDPDRTKITLNGVGVEFEIPDVVRFKGEISYRELEVETSGGTELVRRFDGDIELELISLKLKIDAKLVIGSASGPQGTYTFFAIYLGVELPTGIPLSPTPLALYGMAGLFALRMEPDKKPEEEWYEGWYKRPEIGVTDLKDKWVNRLGSVALGGGVTIGTASDNGFTFACQALFVILIPGPLFLIEGKANLLKERAKLDDDPMFRSLTVIDARQGQILVGLDARYRCDEKEGSVVDISAGTEAFFHTPNDWHIYVGERDPREKRIRAEIFKLFEANSYFMIDQQSLQTGAWVGYSKHWKFGPMSLGLEAWIEGNAAINWKPLHFHGDLWLHGGVDVDVFGFGLSLGVDARIAADVRDPFHVVASLEVYIKLPKPLKSKSVDLTLEWEPEQKWPPQLPLPLKEVAVEHFKVTTAWQLTRTGSQPLLLPNYDSNNNGMRDLDPESEPAIAENHIPPDEALPVVPLDCRPHLSFTRPVHDDAGVGVNPHPVQPGYEQIGNPEGGAEPIQVRYSLNEVVLSKWNGSDWVHVARTPNPGSLRKLFGSWAVVPQLPTGTGQSPIANVKLWLWSATPFDYTRHTRTPPDEKGWDDWLTHALPSYPCLPPPIAKGKVCCDFERVDRKKLLKSVWTSPEHPEISLSWLAPDQQRVKVLEPPVNGFRQALCFPALARSPLTGPDTSLFFFKLVKKRQIFALSPLIGPKPPQGSKPGGFPWGIRPTIPNTVTIKLSVPAKWVEVLLAEEKKADKVCLDFRNRPRGDISSLLNEQGVAINIVTPHGTSDSVATIDSATTTLGDLTGLSCFAFSTTNLTLHCAASTVELMLSYQPLSNLQSFPDTVPPLSSLQSFPDTVPPSIVAFDSKGNQITKPMQNPPMQPEIIRFEGNNLKQIKIFCGSNRVFLHELCFLCPDTSSSVTATGFDSTGRPAGTVEHSDNAIKVTGTDLTQVQLTGKEEICLLQICACLGPDPKALADLKNYGDQIEEGLEHLRREGEVLEPFSAYRLKIVTNIDAISYGNELSGGRNKTQIEYAYFRTEGPPGLANLTIPVGREADKFDSGLDDLTRYVRQTIPATVPAAGEKPVMAKSFYRAYDYGVDFNENYVDLMYRLSGRDLGLYLYDSNNLRVRDVEGRLLVLSGDWGPGDSLTLTEGEKRWVALVNANQCKIPTIKEEDIVRDKKLASAIAGRVLEPDTVYEARLIPLLLRENFRAYPTSAIAQGTGSKLGRWIVRDEGNSNAPSKWEVREAGTPPSRYLVQTSGIKKSKDADADTRKPGTLLVFGEDKRLKPEHAEQPANWTDYRVSVYLHSVADGAMGVVFRYRNDNYYRFSLDRKRKYRRLVKFINGVVQTPSLKEDDFAYQPNQDYLITIEAIGNKLRVYQDGALVFDVTDEPLATHSKGSIGLYCYDNPGAQFSDVQVDDFRQPAEEDKLQKTDRAVYRFQFTTSLFANFFHHLHSYQDETWHAAINDVPGAEPALHQAAPLGSLPTDDEARAYETLATAVLGQAARQNPSEVQVTRVEINGAPLALLLQSPEPIDWQRTKILVERSELLLPQPSLPGFAKLASVAFGANKSTLDSVTLLLRERGSLKGYRLESRVVTWLKPIEGETGISTQQLERIKEPAWVTYHIFNDDTIRPAGTQLKIPAVSVTPDQPPIGIEAGKVGQFFTTVTGVELRLVAPDGKLVHSRCFLPADNYVAEDLQLLRKADGTGFFLAKLIGKLNLGLSESVPLATGDYRLRLTYHRDNTAAVPGSLIYSEAGDRTAEEVVLDIPWQTH